MRDGARVNIEMAGHTNQEAVMSVIYIGQSQAKPAEIDHLRDFLTSIVGPGVRSAEGCDSYQLFQSETDPAQFIGIEVWTSIEAHRASVKNISLDSIADFMKLVAQPSSGGYYRRV